MLCFLHFNSIRYGVLSTLLLMLAGCVSPTTVHIYGKYFDDADLQPLVSALKENDYEVETNLFDPPASVTNNAILYSLLLDDSTKLEQVKTLVKQAGFNVNDFLPLTRANHWYTKNSMALILFPDDIETGGHIFVQDLDNSYKSKDCGAELTLTLNEDGSYLISGDTGDYEWTEEDLDVLSGTWLYRQFPYLELRTKTHNDQYTYYMYFEISKRSERDKISKIEMLQLNPVQKYSATAGCSFEFGERLSN